jgi:hypothetical protein
MQVEKRVIVSFKNLKPDVLEALKEEYPYGYQENVMKISKGNGEFFYAIQLDYQDTIYLVKVDVKIDNIEDLEKQYFDTEEVTEEVTEPEIPENIADESNEDF